MGVYIKGMEMPKSCRDCGIEQEGFWCGALDGYQNTRCFTNERREDCPLVHVPPHGRLIEAERLKEVFHRNVASGEAFDQLIDIAPTIIPASGGAEDE